MAAVTGTLTGSTEFAGGHKFIVVDASIGSSSDTITLTEADHGITGIVGLTGALITGGLTTAFAYLEVSNSGLVITVNSFRENGVAANDFIGTTVQIGVLGTL